ncbi:hypothetical protein CONCODRAFT_19646 [Conidiobolus coronatus NRRL 28638]|uniref:Zn(2)-C6 fungal-type domain-containing protein n=1 Tax=Conidiobolus coronatus (strain ATCC 28846 / CBS 209.66 / NRRL 28638) TaxID=796925 RepID=A0A137NXI0_CONC2|nr:hypothetical protein CONCODRAFT_19646 [Conidiobolus coronatus NRRL 28638]|eukprot:KXN67388.1 hypothetical protein CONCODRAFT_19646 [Conidiobolus coronatus NRRL 28638]
MKITWLNNDASTLMAHMPCDRCRQKRIRCDRDLNQCNHCEKHDAKCTYNYELKKRGPKTKIDHDLIELEKILNLNQNSK